MIDLNMYLLSLKRKPGKSFLPTTTEKVHSRSENGGKFIKLCYDYK